MRAHVAYCLLGIRLLQRLPEVLVGRTERTPRRAAPAHYTSSVNTSSSPSSGTFCGIGHYTFPAAKARAYNGVRHRAVVRPYPREYLHLGDQRQRTRQQRTLGGERTFDRSSAISFLSCGLVIALSGTIALPALPIVIACFHINEDARARP